MPVLDALAAVAGPTGVQVISGPSNIVSSTIGSIISSNLWWLIDPDDPTQNISIEVVSENLPITSSEVQAQHLVLGADFVTIIADTIKGDVFPVTIDFLTDASYQAFVALRAQQKILLLQAPWAQWWFRFGSDITPTVQNVASLYRTVDVQIIGQARP
jgi:hypothetical protein